MNLGSLVQDPKFANDNEKSFSMFSVRRHEADVARRYLLLAQISWIPLFIIGIFKLSILPEVWLFCGIQFVKAMICLILLGLRLSGDFKRKAVYVLLLAAQLAWTYVALAGPSGGHLDRYLVGVWIALLFFGNSFLPVRSYAHNVMFVVVIVTAHYGLKSYFERDLASMLVAIALMLGQNYSIYSHRLVKLSAIGRYREQARYIPKKVLFTAERENVGLMEVFAPAPRYCVCICSDWRGFQALTRVMPMEKIGDGLATYYQRLQDQLIQVLPDGNFFFDWVADELFMVVFAMNERASPEIAKLAFLAARRIIEFRYQFFVEHGFPAGVDVGVASGVASVGVFTSGAVVKATAFGNVPGEARSLQDIAKGLRQTHRSVDRVVMSESFAVDAGFPAEDCTAVDSAAGARVLIWPSLV